MGIFPKWIYFFDVVGHTQLVGFASPTQTLGLQIVTFVVFLPVPAAVSVNFVVDICATFFHVLLPANAAFQPMGKLRSELLKP
jgi:hypothetical protein